MRRSSTSSSPCRCCSTPPGDVETGYAVSSLAQVYLRTGDAARAAEQAQTALGLLGGREDALEEIGNVQLVLGRALIELGRPEEAEDALAAAEASFSTRESMSLLAAAWMARGGPRFCTRRLCQRRRALPQGRGSPPGLLLLEGGTPLRKITPMSALVFLVTSAPSWRRSSTASRRQVAPAFTAQGRLLGRGSRPCDPFGPRRGPLVTTAVIEPSGGSSSFALPFALRSSPSMRLSASCRRPSRSPARLRTVKHIPTSAHSSWTGGSPARAC